MNTGASGRRGRIPARIDGEGGAWTIWPGANILRASQRRGFFKKATIARVHEQLINIRYMEEFYRDFDWVRYLYTCMRARLIVVLNTVQLLCTCAYVRLVKRDKGLPITVLNYTVD